MGGKVAQLLASRRPAGLVGLVLVAPATPTPTHFPEEALQQQLHAYDSRETVLQTIAFLCARRPDAPTVEQIVEDSLSGVPEAKLAWPTAGIREDISAEVGQIDVPTLLQVIPGSGHLVPIDEPVALARALQAFVAELRATRRC